MMLDDLVEMSRRVGGYLILTKLADADNRDADARCVEANGFVRGASARWTARMATAPA